MTGALAEKRSKAGVMRKFVIHELSGVDNPAQGEARAVFMKRRDVKGLADQQEPKSDKTGGIDWKAKAKAAQDELDGLAKARAEKDGCTYAKAYEAVSREKPELFAAAV